MTSTAQIGKVKNIYPLRTRKVRIKSKLKRIFKLSRKRIAAIIILSSIFSLGIKEFYMQISTAVKDYYVSADSNYYENSPLKIDIHSVVAVDNKDDPEVLGTTSMSNKISTNVSLMDKRSYIFDQYFLAHNSPLYGTGHIFVEKCDQYGAPRDCIIAVAIARNETDLCTYYYSAEMHNCWGFGGGGSYRINFSSFDESIDRVTKSLALSYGSKYIIDPSLMEGTFCGDEPGCVGWGDKIKFFVKEVDSFGQSLGLGSLLELRN